MGKQTIEHMNIAVVVSHPQLKELIKLYIKSGKVLFIWGAIGVGKSDMVRAAGKELAQEHTELVEVKTKEGTELKAEAKPLIYAESIDHVNDLGYFNVLDIRLSQMDPSDLRGLPIFDKENNVTRWLPPNSFPKEGYGIMFFDEFNLSPPLVQSSSYQLILSKLLGDYKLPVGYGIVCAGNRISDRANTFELAAPLKNRQGHVELKTPSVEDWTEWATKHAIDIRIISFLNVRQGCIHTFDPKSKENAFATPRTWEFTSDLVKEIPSEDQERLKMVMASMVGTDNANEFISFLKLRDQLRPIDEYIKNADTIDIPDDMALQWALISGIVEYFKAKPNETTLKGVVKLSKRMSEEYATFLLKLMWAVDNSIQTKIVKIPEANELAKKLWKFLR